MLFLFLVFLIPITVYCLVLAGINRRLHPVMVSGLWDCVGLLFAASGFLLVVAPGLLTIFYIRSVGQLLLEQGARTAPDALADLVAGWWWIFLLYYAFVVILGLTLVWFRRQKTVIYNIGLDQWERVFAQVLCKLGLEQRRIANRVILADPAPTEETTLVIGNAVPESPHEEKAQRARNLHRTETLRIDPFPSLCNITLHWEGHAPELREEIEIELARTLKMVETDENPAASWFMGIGGILVGMIFLIVLALILFALPRHV